MEQDGFYPIINQILAKVDFPCITSAFIRVHLLTLREGCAYICG